VNESLLKEVTRVTIYTLAFMITSMVLVMLYGLFDDKVNNDKIFEVFTPAFQMCIGSFVGFLGGIQVGKKDNES
jgi:hypothetical protein